MGDRYLDILVDVIDKRILKIVRSLPFDYTIAARIKTDNGGGTYVAVYNDEDITVKAKDGLSLVVGDIVYIRCPSGRFEDRYIDCKRP